MRFVQTIVPHFTAASRRQAGVHAGLSGGVVPSHGLAEAAWPTASLSWRVLAALTISGARVAWMEATLLLFPGAEGTGVEWKEGRGLPAWQGAPLSGYPLTGVA